MESIAARDRLGHNRSSACPQAVVRSLAAQRYQSGTDWPTVGTDSILNKRAQLWNSAEVFVLVLVLVLSGAVLAIEKDGKSLAN